MLFKLLSGDCLTLCRQQRSEEFKSDSIVLFSGRCFYKECESTQLTICREILLKSKAHNYNDNKFEARLHSR